MISPSEIYGHSSISKQLKKVMFDWDELAQESKVPQLMKMAITTGAYRIGIFLPGTTASIWIGKVEGMNKK